jgi:hypothetical protein
MLSVMRKMATACVVYLLCVSVGYAFAPHSRTILESCYSPGDCSTYKGKALNCVETGDSSTKECSCRLKDRGGRTCNHS